MLQNVFLQTEKSVMAFLFNFTMIHRLQEIFYPFFKKKIDLRIPMTFIYIYLYRECVRNLDLRVQVHPGELVVLKQRVHIVLEASKSAGAKGDVPKICRFVHPLHPC